MTAFKVGVPSVVKTIKTRRPGMEEETFTADIRIRDTDEQEALNKLEQEGELTGHAHVREDVLSIGGFEDAKGKIVDSTDDARVIDAMFKDPYALAGLIRGWQLVQSGMPEYVEKN